MDIAMTTKKPGKHLMLGAAFVARLRELGMSDAELDQAGRRNPAALLGLS